MTKTIRSAWHIPVVAIALAATMLVMGAPTTPAATPGVLVQNDNNRIAFDDITWRANRGSYDVRPRGATGGVVTSIALRQVRQISVRAPDSLAAAVKAVSGGQTSGAPIATLEAIVQQFEMLGPDLEAGRWLARAYNATGRSEDAVKICTKVAGPRPQSQLSWGIVMEWWDALLKTGQTPELERRLDAAIRDGNAELQAVAHVKRGDILMAAGKFREALVDGYLRTIVLFGGIKDVQAEAMAKAVKCFDSLGEAQNGERMRKTMLAEYPESPYTRQLQSGI